MKTIQSFLLPFAILVLLGSSTHGQSATAESEARPALESEVDQVQDATAETKSGEGESKKKRKAKKKGDFDHFIRILKDRKGRPVAMQTSVTRYEGKNDKGEPVTVDLIGVVHVGEKDYYKQFNKIFKKYDSVLYELVAPEGTVIPKGGRADATSLLNPIAAIQKGMQQTLGLEFQLEHIDYTKKNFVHADMTPEEFSESMKKNEESISKMFLKAMGQSLAMQQRGGGGDMGMVLALFSKNKTLRLRRAMASQMQQMEGGMAMFEGKEGSTIIDHRNAKAMEILKRELNSGKNNVAIFYGAGHLDDMQRRLFSDFKMKRGGQFWMDAWKLTKREFKR